MQEDCLVMNIFVPDTEQENLPVMVDIHGGAYYSGLGNAHRFTDFAALNNVIVVTFNYRIGLLGFLCLGTEKIPGNAGMKDQITALRWVKRNIATFGGDPNDVTITGCSAGGSSVDLLLVSKMSEGLFNRAIPDSGSNLGSFTVQFDPIANSKQIPKILILLISIVWNS
ncbi:LOW QUALITY PROTEIN: bile salt-activated lipase-like [Bombyx mandarina]|uniref:Carboxylic ester hydrolase n=1 Tax=Bombyx mandarina TaxID=7092 RepID=A0A6J2JFU0_BOMMA|nr:LOW QUALITY PROTEIN: bile salt-activated lipase-like [Bombyx mandarina]